MQSAAESSASFMAVYFQDEVDQTTWAPGYGAYFFDQMPPLFLRLLFEDGVYLAQSFHVCGYYLRVATIRGQHIFDSINSYNAI